MTPPAELLEQALTKSGDPLYRLALLLAGDEAGAERLLRASVAALVAAWRESPPAVPPGEPELLADLVAAARADEEQRAKQRPARPRGQVAFGPFALGRLPLEQRAALGLFLLFGYDGLRIAQVTGAEPAVARAALVDAVRALGPAAGHSLPDRVSGELCGPVRASLADPSAGSRHGAAVRGHLATCGLCRAFDQSWGEIVSAVEAQVRAALRERDLPAPLCERLLALARPPRRRISPSLRYALPPLAVLALIAALVLPGFLQAPVSVVQRDDSPPRDPQELLAQALDRQTVPPDRGAIWYGRFETLWFFDEEVYAPLHAEVWLDPRNAARHRLQLTHAAGGAPYELQVGNGRDRLYYALDQAYVPALYGSLATRARDEQPALATIELEPAGQERALVERLATGPWQIGPSYLRQAQGASDLRVLGRQRDGGRTVQILSFSGVSPLGSPPDAPGATAERVTVLLAIDLEDGLLRTATELAGPAGAEQTSRVTWRITQESYLGTGQQIDAAFDVGQAWTGTGDFSDRGRDRVADVAVPLISKSSAGDPIWLVSGRTDPVWMPSAPPPGVERAVLLWRRDEFETGSGPRGVIYLGQDRRLLLLFNLSRPLNGEPFDTDVWDGTLRPGPAHRYKLALERAPDDQYAQYSGVDQSAVVLIDAFGFSRDELREVVAGMRPADLASVAAQDALFAAGLGAPEARALLLDAALAETVPPAENAAHLVRGRQTMRQGPQRDSVREDPYAQPYYLLPAVAVVEEWRTAPALGASLKRLSTPAGELVSQLAFGGDDGWQQFAETGILYRFSSQSVAPAYQLSEPATAAFEFLGVDADRLSTERLADGTTRVTWVEEAAGSMRFGHLLGDASGDGQPYLFDLQPATIDTELDLAPDGLVTAMRIYAVGGGGRRTLVKSYEVSERSELPLADAPAALRDGDVPDALYVADYRGNDGAPGSGYPIVTRTLTEALALAPGAVYLLGDGAALQQVEDGPLDSAPAAAGWFNNGEYLLGAISQRLAARYTYSVEPARAGDSPWQLRITQGPAGPLGAFLRVSGSPQWRFSESRRLEVAGRPVEAWYGEGDGAQLILELGDTMLIVEADGVRFDEDVPAALATLRPAPRR